MSAKRSHEDEADPDNLSFEDALEQLNETVQALEAGELFLAEATRLYEKGMRLTRICSEALVAAELKITQIETAYGQQVKLSSEEQPELEGLS